MPPSWLGPVVQGGVALGSTLLAGRRRPEETQGVQGIQNVLQMGRDISGNLVPMGTGMVRSGMNTMQPSLNYYRGLLAGGEEATAAASPDIQRTAQQYEAVRKAQAELTPRGGGRAAVLNELPYQQQRDVSNLITQQREKAAPELVQAGAQVANTGSQTLNTAINALYSTTTAGRDLLDYSKQRQATDIEQGKSIGGSILDIVKGVAPKIFQGAAKTAAGAGAGAATGAAAGLGGGAVGLGGVAPSVEGGTAAAGGGGSILSGVVGGAKTAASTAGHGASTLLSIAAAHPLAALAIGAGVGGAILAKHFIGQGRRAADVLTKEGGLQNSFEKTLHEIDAMNIPDDQKWQHKQEAYNALVKMGMEHAKKGDNQKKVVTQMFNTISPLFGQQNPMGAAA